MQTRLLLTVTLFLTLLVSGWSTVIAATLCPHTMAQDHSCCHAMKTSGHDEAMGDMQMPMHASETTGDATAGAIGVGQPAAQCAHCVSHSSAPASTVFAISAFQQSKRSVLAAAFLTGCLPTTRAFSFTANLISKQKAVPKTATAERHILISVFRI